MKPSPSPRRKALELSFGAEIVELKASKSSHYKDRDGRLFPFSFDIPSIPNLASFFARTMELGASTNERKAARKATNTNNFRLLKMFGLWLEKQDSPKLSESLLRRFRDEIFENHSVGYAYGIYTVVAKSLALLIEDGAIEKFTIPENASRNAVIASSAKTGTTLATAIEGSTHDASSVDDINESMLKTWISAAWLEIDRLCGRIENAKAWRREVNDKWTPPDWILLGKHITVSRTVLTKTLIQLIAKKFGDRIPASFLQDINDSPNDSYSIMISKVKLKAQRMEKTISSYEIVSYFFPTAPLAGLALSLFCCAQINPDSAARLTIFDLIEDEVPDRKRLLWHKGRAGGPQTAMPFPIGTQNSKTIPRLWDRLMLASAELRAGAPHEARPYLFIWGAIDPSDKPVRLFGEEKKTTSVWTPAKKYLMGELQELPTSPETLAAIAPLKDYLQKINLALLRNTAINIAAARLSRDFSATAKMDGRRTAEVLENHYLNNPQTREYLDSDIRKAQSFLQNWVHSKPVILPPKASVISQLIGVDQSTAQSLIEEEHNLGNGASLLNENAIFIDTPINALRIIQWLRHLTEAQPRMMRENPGRWSRLFQPQTRLFQEALHAFSRPSISEAREIDQEINLPFPPIY